METKGYKVLIADDSSFARRIVTKYLANTEFEVIGQAKSDAEAVALFKELSPDIVLLDIIMPVEGGMEALRGIKALNPAAKVIMLSSLGTEEAVTECISLGAATFVQKPCHQAQLMSALNKLVGK